MPCRLVAQPLTSVIIAHDLRVGSSKTNKFSGDEWVNGTFQKIFRK